MKDFYQDIITAQSWQLLLELEKQFKFILIGGWAVYLYTKALKSKDIDVIVDFGELEKLKKLYDLHKNDRLHKYEIKKEGVDIDIYLPYYSNIGLPVEEVMIFTDKKETFTLLRKEILLITKQKAYQERKVSIKGQKDKIDIISLLFLTDFDFDFYVKIITKYELMSYKKMLIDILSQTKEIEELAISKHHFAQKKKAILREIS